MFIILAVISSEGDYIILLIVHESLASSWCHLPVGMIIDADLLEGGASHSLVYSESEARVV